MEIGVERDADTRLGSRVPENICVLGTTHADFG
jgi:hypothetical protein